MIEDDCMIIVRTNKIKHYYDMKKIDYLQGKPYNGNCIYGPENRKEIAKNVQPEICYKKEEILTIKKGCTVMCTENLCTPWGICNGSMGKVYDVILNDDKELEYIIVQFDDLNEQTMRN